MSCFPVYYYRNSALSPFQPTGNPEEFDLAQWRIDLAWTSPNHKAMPPLFASNDMSPQTSTSESESEQNFAFCAVAEYYLGSECRLGGMQVLLLSQCAPRYTASSCLTLSPLTRFQLFYQSPPFCSSIFTQHNTFWYQPQFSGPNGNCTQKNWEKGTRWYMALNFLVCNYILKMYFVNHKKTRGGPRFS